MELFLAGCCTKNEWWQVLGIFTLREDALLACRCEHCFTAPLKAGIILPHDTLQEWVGLEFYKGDGKLSR